MNRTRLTVYLSHSVADRLAIACKRPGANKSKLVDRALDRFLTHEGSNSSEALLARRLDLVSRQTTKTDRNIAVILETLGLFVRYTLTITPPLPKSEQDPARALGNQRFESFVAQIGKRLAAGQSTMRDVMERVAAHDPDLFAGDLDETAMLAKHPRGEAPAPASQSPASMAPGASFATEAGEEVHG